MWRRSLWEDSTARFPFGKRVGLTSLLLVSLKREIIFTFCDMSGVITVANCNHFAAGECWSACLLLVLKTNKQKRRGFGWWKQLVSNRPARFVTITCGRHGFFSEGCFISDPRSWLGIEKWETVLVSDRPRCFENFNAVMNFLNCVPILWLYLIVVC